MPFDTKCIQSEATRLKHWGKAQQYCTSLNRKKGHVLESLSLDLGLSLQLHSASLQI